MKRCKSIIGINRPRTLAIPSIQSFTRGNAVTRGGVRISPTSDSGATIRTPDQVAGVITLRGTDAIGSSAGDELFVLLCETEEAAAAVAQSSGLMQVRDEGRIDAWCDEAIAAQPQAAADFRAGKEAAMGRLVGAVMKASGGQADAKSARAKLAERLGK